MKTKFIILIFILTIFLSGCQSNKDVSKEEKSIPVKVKQLSLEENDELISYIGIVNSEQVKKYSFKSGGKIEDINVAVGQYVEKDAELASLDKKDLELQVQAAKNQMDAAYAQYEKALNGAQDEDVRTAELNVEKASAAYDFAFKNYEDMKKLFEEEAISETVLQEANLNFKIAQSELEQSKEQYEKALAGSRDEDVSAARANYQAAKTGYDAQNSLLESAVLISDVDGYIVDVLFEKGEIIGAGYPVVVVRSEMQVVNVGISQKDIVKISEGTYAIVKINDNEYKGEISSINQTPDIQSRTYNVEITLEEIGDKIYMGSTAKVDFVTGISRGIWIDIPYILNDGQDYVFVCEDNRAVRKNIILGSIYEDKVKVEGLEKENLLIIKGVKNLKEGYKVIVTE